MDTNIFDTRIEMTIQTLIRVDPDAWIEDEEKEPINVAIPIPKRVKKFLEVVLEGGKETLGQSPEDFKSAIFYVLVLRGIMCSAMGLEAAEDLVKGLISSIPNKSSGDFQSAVDSLNKINMNDLKEKNNEVSK